MIDVLQKIIDTIAAERPIAEQDKRLLQELKSPNIYSHFRGCQGGTGRLEYLFDCDKKYYYFL